MRRYKAAALRLYGPILNCIHCAITPFKSVSKCRGVNPGAGGRDPPDYGQGVRGGRKGVVGVVKYYNTLSCRLQEVCSKVMSFEEK